MADPLDDPPLSVHWGWANPDVERRLLDAIADEPPCDDPNCCPPRDSRSYRMFKAAVVVTIAVIFLLVLKAVALG